MATAKPMDDKPTPEVVCSARSATSRFLSDLPSDFSIKTRKRLLLKALILAFLGMMLFFTLAVAIGSIGLWFSGQLLAATICIFAAICGAAPMLLDADSKVPDLRLPLTDIERDYRSRDTMQIVFFVSWLVLLGLGAVLWGLEGFITLMASIGVGLFGSALYSLMSARVHHCVYCDRVTRFRKFHGKWTCIMCGNPLR